LRILINEINKIYDELLPKYDEYIKRFNLKIEIPIEDLEYKDFQIVPKNKNDVNKIKSIKFKIDIFRNTIYIFYVFV
jgi:hypothetical protein